VLFDLLRRKRLSFCAQNLKTRSLSLEFKLTLEKLLNLAQLPKIQSIGVCSREVNDYNHQDACFQPVNFGCAVNLAAVIRALCSKIHYSCRMVSPILPAVLLQSADFLANVIALLAVKFATIVLMMAFWMLKQMMLTFGKKP